MSVTEQILNGMRLGRENAEDILNNLVIGDDAARENFLSELALDDNVSYMKRLLESGYRKQFKMIYIDPPFFTRSKFNATVSLRTSSGEKKKIRHLAFDDRFERNLEYYIANMTERLLLMKKLLSDDGLIWVHLDWHSSHYVKLVLDDIFGEKNFVNEIIWCYKSGGSGKKHFSRKHDTILVYSKSSKYSIHIPEEKSYNRGYKPYNFKGVKEYCDDLGWYTLVNMKDVWNVDMVGRTSAERNGYATQKPLELMKRIVEAGSNPGDLVGDFFCGSGSLLEAAESLGRKWVGCDTESLAFSLARKRLVKSGADFATRYLEQSAGNNERAAGRVDILVNSSELLEDGRYLVKCSIGDFIPDVDIGYVLMSDRKFIEASLDDDTTSLIDYIMIDRGDDSTYGKFESPQIIDENFDDMTVIVSGTTPISVVDVFGREYYSEIIP